MVDLAAVRPGSPRQVVSRSLPFGVRVEVGSFGSHSFGWLPKKGRSKAEVIPFRNRLIDSDRLIDFLIPCFSRIDSFVSS